MQKNCARQKDLHVMSTANPNIPSNEYPLVDRQIVFFMSHVTQKHILSTDEQAATFSMIFFVVGTVKWYFLVFLKNP